MRSPTLKTLYLLRHAKSSWSHPALADHERPLAARGRKAARRMASYLAQERPRPGLVLCSSAARARQTCDALGRGLAPSAHLRVEDGLYEADGAQLLARLQSLPEDAAAVLVIGHNPGLWDLAVDLAGEGDSDSLTRLRGGFPTGALARLSADGPWADLGPGRADLEAFVVPRGLSG